MAGIVGAGKLSEADEFRFFRCPMLSTCVEGAFSLTTIQQMVSGDVQSIHHIQYKMSASIV